MNWSIGVFATRLEDAIVNVTVSNVIVNGNPVHRIKPGEIIGEMPSAALSDEIVLEGEGQVKALISIGGNPLIFRQEAVLAPVVNLSATNGTGLTPAPTSRTLEPAGKNSILSTTHG